MRTLNIDDCSQEYVDWINDSQINRYLETRWSTQDLSGDLKGALCYNCMNNTDNEMFPIDSDLSNQIDVKSFYLESRDNLRIELENRDNNK